MKSIFIIEDVNIGKGVGIMIINEDIVSTLVLSDGKKLTYQEYGDLVGYPIILFHGTPRSRLWFMEDDPIALELGVRLITFDRPGYSGSDPKPCRKMLDWAEDVNETVQLLKLIF